MGTSANLLVKSGSKTFIHRTRYDGYPSQIFSLLGSTLAAVGVESLKQSIEQATLFDTEDYGDDESGLTVGFERYLKAAERQNHEPYLLFDVVKFQRAGEFYATDFAHAGAIPLFASPLYNLKGWGDEADADYVLDLNEGTLTTSWEPSLVIALSVLEGKDPDAISELFNGEKFRNVCNEEETQFKVFANSEGVIDLALALKSEIDALPAIRVLGEEDLSSEKQLPSTLPDLNEQSALMDDFNHSYGSSLEDSKVKPQLHVFYAHPENGGVLLYLASLLQKKALNTPELAIPGVLKFDFHSSQYSALVIDFSQHLPSKALSKLLEKLGEFGVGVGLNYEYRSEQGYSTIYHGGRMSHASSGCLPGETVNLFAGDPGAPLDPSKMTLIPSRVERLENIRKEVAEGMSDEQLKGKAILAYSMIDQEVVDLLPNNKVVLNKEDWEWCKHLFTGLHIIDEALLPGDRKQRWAAFDPQLAEKMVEGLSLVDQRILERSLGLAGKKSPRP